MHDAGTRHPYTVSPLIGGKSDRNGISIIADRGYRIRFTVLDPALFSVFSRYFAESTAFDLALTLGRTSFVIEDITTAQQPDDWSGYTTFEKLLSVAKLDPLIAMRFYSLTAFSVGRLEDGKPKFGIFPQPDLVFDSLTRRWNMFADKPLGEPKEWQTWINEHVIVRRYRTESDLWQFDHHPQIGFLGDCTYEIKGDHPAEARVLNALADFAFYAGVGSRTGMGMGQVKRLTAERKPGR